MAHVSLVPLELVEPREQVIKLGDAGRAGGGLRLPWRRRESQGAPGGG
jgi:hypothetical protein